MPPGAVYQPRDALAELRGSCRLRRIGGARAAGCGRNLQGPCPASQLTCDPRRDVFLSSWKSNESEEEAAATTTATKETQTQ